MKQDFAELRERIDRLYRTNRLLDIEATVLLAALAITLLVYNR